MFYETRARDKSLLPHDPFKAIIAPRPIGWISTRAKDGRVNLAPYSFFNAFASMCRRATQAIFTDLGEAGKLRLFDELNEVRDLASIAPETRRLPGWTVAARAFGWFEPRRSRRHQAILMTAPELVAKTTVVPWAAIATGASDAEDHSVVVVPPSDVTATVPVSLWPE